MPSKEHDEAVQKLIRQGYKTHGFMKAVRSHLNLDELEELSKSEFRIVPDAWKYDEEQNLLVAVEVVKTHDVTPEKRNRYAKLWSLLDAEGGPNLIYMVADAWTVRPVPFDPMDDYYKALSELPKDPDAPPVGEDGIPWGMFGKGQ